MPLLLTELTFGNVQARLADLQPTPGLRLENEPECFDAYGPIEREDEIIGPSIPLDATPGRGRLLGAVAYDCNPLQRARLVNRGHAAGPGVRDPAAGPAVTCPALDQDLSAVVALACLLAGLIIGGAVAAREITAELPPQGE
ncbi:hypothetical protein [Methylobacterium hispanicum]|uniref:hypothetical protein n=1 Tax=Methylobacterium hispanicum TaxID=270350 RepID=UPI002F330465